jgi:hypothetical protein
MHERINFKENRGLLGWLTARGRWCGRAAHFPPGETVGQDKNAGDAAKPAGAGIRSRPGERWWHRVYLVASGRNLKHDLSRLVRRAGQHFMCAADIPQPHHGSDSRIQLHAIDQVGDGVQPWRRHIYIEKN